MPFIVPGIGYAGLGQQTSANQLVFQQAQRRNGNGGMPKARKKRSRVRAVRVTGKAAEGRLRRSRRSGGRRKKSGARRASMVKGSAAAKRHMAKLRAMRK